MLIFADEAVYICTKLALGVIILVPLMLLSILYAYTQISSISTLLGLSYLYTSVRGPIRKAESERVPRMATCNPINPISI